MKVSGSLSAAWNGLFLSLALAFLPLPTSAYAATAGTWSTAGSMMTPHVRHTATRLLNGKVLIVGGIGGSSAETTAELFDPATGKFSATGNLNNPRSDHTATLM